MLSSTCALTLGAMQVFRACYCNAVLTLLPGERKGHIMTRSKAAFLAEADELIHKPQFSREDASRVESILAMADRLPDDLGARQNDLTSVLPVDRSFRAYLSRGQNAVKEGVIDSKRL